MMTSLFPKLTICALFVLLVTGHPLPEEPESGSASQASAHEIADAVKQVSAASPASEDAAAEAAAAESVAEAAAPDGAAAAAAPVEETAVAPLGAGAADAALPHISGAVSGPRYEHASHQQSARQEGFSEAAQGAQQGSQAAESGEAFKKVEGFENQSGFRKQDGFSEKSSNRYGSGFFQGSEGQHDFNLGNQHSFGVAGYGAHDSQGVVGSPNFHELLKVGFIP
ncbi:testis-specific gene A8 protein-like isoform X2 [Dermacentor albipictus]|uniref:testis-specific gene A8 protein-like isoform X2 n=1 Tax=Dermacentor albipictus TaxID=60249 RepID=UPI0031FE0CF0